MLDLGPLPRISHYVHANILKSKEKKNPQSKPLLVLSIVIVAKGHLKPVQPFSPFPFGCLHIPGGSHLLFCRDVAIHQGRALHTSHLDMGSNVPEFQAQVLPSDGDLGAPFPRTRHWDDLQRKREVILQAPRSITAYLLQRSERAWAFRVLCILLQQVQKVCGCQWW